MKVQNWWVKKDLLTSGIDPARELSGAADQFPDEYDPMVFMTGDGHSHPPFMWTDNGVWKGFFKDITAANKICCHVELFADQVTVNAVPKNLEGVFYNQKVFGWEPEFFKIVQTALEMGTNLRIKMLGEESMTLTDIRKFATDLLAVSQAGYLQNESQMAQNYLMKAQRVGKEVIPHTSMLSFDVFLKSFNITAMELRCVANDVIAANIQRVMKQYPDHMHLITCGNAHIYHNPLHLLIQPPIGTFGIVDESK